MYTGANVDDTHLRGVDVERDINVGQWADLREVAAGDQCINCGHGLEVERGIEVGHIFKLGSKYTEAMQIRVSGPDGKSIRPVMGCYGIGVERAMATVVEVHYDAKGIIWPVAVAPFEVVVVIAQQDDPAVAEAGEEVYEALADAGVDVIVDDRPVRAGVKFSDAELVGIPFRVTIGKRGLAAGTAELTERESGTTVQIPLADLASARPRGHRQVTRRQSLRHPRATDRDARRATHQARPASRWAWWSTLRWSAWPSRIRPSSASPWTPSACPPAEPSCTWGTASGTTWSAPWPPAWSRSTWTRTDSARPRTATGTCAPWPS